MTPGWDDVYSYMDLRECDGQAPTCCPVVELRQYTLKPEARDTLIQLFEREFVESQEDIGMRIIGTFRNLEKPDCFVWIRGFQDMPSRAAQLQEFYGGLVWKAHREVANATMIDSDNVLLLRPVSLESGFLLRGAIRAPHGAAETSAGVIVATIYHLKRTGSEFAGFFSNSIVPMLSQTGVPILASFVTEHHPNTFPALPVREDANVFVWFTRSPDLTTYEHRYPAEKIRAISADQLEAAPEVLLLAPTSRSLIR